MNTTLLIHSKHTLDFGDFQDYLEIPNLVLDFISEMPESIHWYFHREGTSTTLFAITSNLQDTYEVSIDNLASYDDLKFFPYLVDSLAKFLQGEVDIENLYEEVDEEVMRAHTVIVNCTPLGMHPYEKEMPAIPYKYLTEAHLLYDCIYNPEKTLFLQMGEEHGCRVKNGLEMLHMQADAAWEIWYKS